MCPNPPHLFLYIKVRLLCNCVANTDTLMFNRHVKLSRLTELQTVPHRPPLPIAFSTSVDGNSTFPYAQANKLEVILDISLPLIHI